MKTKDLTGADLNRAVAMALGLKPELVDGSKWPHGPAGKLWATPSSRFKGEWVTLPNYAGSIAAAWPIIDEHGISIIRCDDDYGRDEKGFCTSRCIPVWAATIGQHSTTCSTERQPHEEMFQIAETDVVYGPDGITAALFAFVRHKLGDEIDLEAA